MFVRRQTLRSSSSKVQAENSLCPVFIEIQAQFRPPRQGAGGKSAIIHVSDEAAAACGACFLRECRMNGPLTIGVDIGATKVAAGLVNNAGKICYKARVPMAATGDAGAGLEAVQAAIMAVLEGAPEGRDAQRIGICSPGPVDPRTGIVLNPPNLPCWRNFALAGAVEHAFGTPVRLDNDANAAGLAEALWGAGAGYRNVFCATLGTGIGTGIVFDKRIYHGRTGGAAEGGHVTIDYRGPLCSCGKRGCIQALCSGTAIAERACALMAASGGGSKILELAGGDPAQVRAQHVGQAWRENDALATQVLEETAHFLTIWLGNIVDLLEPDVMVIGGGVAELMSAFFDRMLRELPAWCLNSRAGEIPLLMAHYGADAGIAGAAALWGA
jgi:glucokinase